jgi:transposase
MVKKGSDMPYNSERIPIVGTDHDMRRKLSDEQKRAITILSKEGYSQRKLATMFKCSRRLVQNILQPQTRAKPKQRPASYWSEAKRKYRERKQELYKTGKINENKKRKRKNSG